MPLHQTSTGQASSYIQDGGIEAIYLAFRIPLRNNACTAGYCGIVSILLFAWIYSEVYFYDSSSLGAISTT